MKSLLISFVFVGILFWGLQGVKAYRPAAGARRVDPARLARARAARQAREQAKQAKAKAGARAKRQRRRIKR